MEDDERDEQETWEVGIPLDPYSGDAREESWPEYSAILAKVFVVFLTPSNTCWVSTSIPPRPLPSKSFPVYHPHCTLLPELL
jgi:hypothetical protein